MRWKIGFVETIVVLFLAGAATAPTGNAAPVTDACSLLTQAQLSAVLGV
ncbi:MAG TPA: hypothetical protein VNH65_15490 [Candidatus Acidoferrum sp.]|nr:hypothetical protein [Candidatus Acidoferrum sp.]